MCRRRYNNSYIPSTPYQRGCHSRRQQRRAAILQSSIEHPGPETLVGKQPFRRAKCSKRRCYNQQVQAFPSPSNTPDNTYHPRHHTSSLVPNQPVYQSSPSPYHRRRKGPLSKMASLVILGIGLSAHKINEKRKEKKAEKERREWEQEQVAEARREAEERQSRRKERDARDERDRERSSSSLREAPPRYEDAVQGTGSRAIG
ncbi:hypothetical protein CC78DRAFT_616216 [Lojkania enalia]|uniref:Uncharacterized protein n=1 Tax=Lojkania enalia TaxID=147567 RepID=A0A9P4K9H7_9PLEO|nr:hypothetical protein CC78DRAFT_616216 [Didymosphaeria enalia]